MEEEKQTNQQETQQETQTDQNLQEEHLVVRIVNATCTCDAMSERDHRCQNLPNCVFKTNKQIK